MPLRSYAVDSLASHELEPSVPDAIVHQQAETLSREHFQRDTQLRPQALAASQAHEVAQGI
jgi:hypothetical protein